MKTLLEPDIVYTITQQKKIQIDPSFLEIFSGKLENKVFWALSAHLWGAERPVKHEHFTGTRYSVYRHTVKKNSNRSIRSRDFLWKHRHKIFGALATKLLELHTHTIFCTELAPTFT